MRRLSTSTSGRHAARFWCWRPYWRVLRVLLLLGRQWLVLLVLLLMVMVDANLNLNFFLLAEAATSERARAPAKYLVNAA